MNPYEYRARVVRVIDGDTVELLVDLGFNTYREEKFRVLGIDTPEVYGVKKGSAEYELGKAASNYAKELLPPDAEVMIRTYKDKQGKYGRYLADILIGELNFAEEMIKAGHAVPYEA